MLGFERGYVCVGVGRAVPYVCYDWHIEMEQLVLVRWHGPEGTADEFPNSFDFCVAFGVMGKGVRLADP